MTPLPKQIRSESFTVRITPDLKRTITELAQAEGRTVAAYIERLLEAHAKAMGKAT
ncbi:ribbon-helix-helix protein, CopG family [Methylobacterium ajmalii]|jgi:predicted HicB family RNase H-like nuclease|uniref:ribbon-helix-helix protein, CopG family n=1 Tax=Methylobacterium ajmalii TaxID=2738439 RepID=UPI00190DBCEB|nr:ribbon-helix-helix protein, CopG family [Methylobacterium ajmalii]MBK3400410.1 ribbon-helix-helix protein, CopG family [Methylobacterium ajmalii]MBK3407548.1 ribbon-helix-helix protein, CopG family [Methylobacterium ajmalii]MBK3422104.1 ribbon-helix-helix protein, CopG family [Methylobacterium ajmalii]MBZ6415626.1 type II toxin-antitoxin system HicB family antitoxin [Methylobacterium sp.]